MSWGNCRGEGDEWIGSLEDRGQGSGWAEEGSSMGQHLTERRGSSAGRKEGNKLT